MEITKTFGHTFRDMMLAKLRAFRHRSVYRYALGVALITVAAHGSDPTLTASDKFTRGLIYFTLLCLGVFLLYAISASIQSRSIRPRTVTFTNDTLVVNQNGESANHDWDWIISADETTTMLSLLVQTMPRLELYLPRHKLSDTEYDMLRGWLVSHGKLAPTENVA